MERKKLSLSELHRIKYYNEKSFFQNSVNIEKEEQHDATIFIPPHAVVLELGGRYGIVSSVINNRLDNPRNHLVVEPDPGVQEALQINRNSHNSFYKIFQGVISRKPMYFYIRGFASFCSSIPNNAPIPILTLEELQEKYDVSGFTHLVADCEGGLMDFFYENKDFFKLLEGVYFEEDNKINIKVNYEPLKTFLQENGFQQKKNGFRQYWEKVKLGSEEIPKSDT
jgi:hypothetical protein